jgi:hypothetical protein
LGTLPIEFDSRGVKDWRRALQLDLWVAAMLEREVDRA